MRPIITFLLPIFLGSIVNGQTVLPQLNIPSGHQKKITSVAISPNGKMMLTGSQDNTAILWDVASTFPVRSVSCGEPVQQVFFHPDGQSFYTLAGQDNAELVSKEKYKLLHWNLLTGKLIKICSFTAQPKFSFSGSGNFLLAYDYDADTSAKTSTEFSRLPHLNNTASMNSYIETITSKSMKDAEKYSAQILNLYEEAAKKGETVDSKKLSELQNEQTEKILKQSFSSIYKPFTIINSRGLRVLSAINGVFETGGFIKFGQNEAVVTMQTAIKGKVIEIWPLNTSTAKPIWSMPVSSKTQKMAAARNSSLIAYDSSKNTIIVKDISSGKSVSFICPGTNIQKFEFADDGKMLHVYSAKGQQRFITRWNTVAEKIEAGYKLPDLTGQLQIMVSPDGSYYIADRISKMVKFSKGGMEQDRFEGHTISPDNFGFLNNGNSVAANYYDYPDITGFYRARMALAVESEAAMNKVKLTAQEKERKINEQVWRLNLSAKPKPITILWDLERGGAVAVPFTKDIHTKTSNRFSLYNKPGISSVKDQFPLMKHMLLQTDGISDSTRRLAMKYLDADSAAFKKLFAGTFNTASVYLLNAKTKDSIALVKIDSLDWIMVLQNGYYMCSKNAARKMSFTTGDKVYAFDQFDARYNRPDKVLSALGYASSALIESYNKAYQKRLKRLGLDSMSFTSKADVPVLEIKNIDELQYEQNNGILQMHMLASSSLCNLNALHVIVNEVPEFGSKGKLIKSGRQLETSISIPLSPGKNTISVYVNNAAGQKSLKNSFTVYNPSIPVRSNVYFIGIGLNDFQQPGKKLSYSVKDIRDLVTALHKRYGEWLHVDTLFNQQATKKNILNLKEKLLKISITDKVIIAYSGHGLLDDSGNYYLSTYDIAFDKPSINGMPYDEMENLLDGIPSRQKLLLLDACHSGEVDKEDISGIQAVSAAAGLARGVEPLNKTPKKLGLQSSFSLMHQLFDDLASNTGATVIAAAGGLQFALERQDLKNGVFTHCILNYLNNHSVTTVTALKNAVILRVQEITKGLQSPNARTELKNIEWEL